MSIGSLNRTKANIVTRHAGNESQCEDLPKPERSRVGLKRETT